jgi:hypothetical protein
MSISASITSRSFRRGSALEIQERGLKHTRFFDFLHDQNQLGGDDFSGKVKLNQVPARTQASPAPVRKKTFYETFALS